MRRKIDVGMTFRVCEGSGIVSGKVCTVIPWISDWRSVPNTGMYKPPDRRSEVWVRYEDGRIDAMYKNRLNEDRGFRFKPTE